MRRAPWLIFAGSFILGLTAAAREPVNRLLLVNCRVITLAKGQEDPFLGYIVVGPDGRITQLGKGLAPASLAATEVFDAAGKVAMPGFVSGRTRLADSVRRGLVPEGTAAQWESAAEAPLRRGAVKPGDLYVYTLHGALDLLRAGVTTVYNDTAGAPGLPDALYLEQLDAELDAGGHFVFGYRNEPALSPEEFRGRLRAYLARSALRQGSGLLLGTSLSRLELRGSEESFKARVDLWREFPALGEDWQIRYLGRPGAADERANFAWLKRAGLLGPHLSYASFLYPDGPILADSSAAGVAVIWSPLSEGRLGEGMADAPGYLRKGMTVGLGIDSLSSAGVADPFENMRMGLYGIRFRDSDPRGLQPLDMLRLHTIGAARAIHVGDRVGTLEPGKEGDIVLIDPHWPDTGPVVDLYATLVLACDRMNIADVFVAGKLVVRGKSHAWLDLDGVAHEAIRRAAGAAPSP